LSQQIVRLLLPFKSGWTFAVWLLFYSRPRSSITTPAYSGMCYTRHESHFRGEALK
jgi:hypothetical protein